MTTIWDARNKPINLPDERTTVDESGVIRPVVESVHDREPHPAYIPEHLRGVVANRSRDQAGQS